MDKYYEWGVNAVADGWAGEPLYPKSASSQSAARLTKDGWTVHILNGISRSSVAVWGPDGLRVKTPFPYSFEALIQALRTCLYCSAENVDTQRVSFAGRCCGACITEQRKRLEYPGWTN